MTEGLRIERNGPSRILWLDRPGRGNSLSGGLVEALLDAVEAAADDGVRALILRGEGANFCTGFDLSDVADANDGELLLRFVRIEQLLARLWSAPFATIAIGQGRVTGAGADLFCVCEQRFAVDGAMFSFPGAGFGLVLGTRRLSQRVGAPAAVRLVESGAPIDSMTALRLGLASEILALHDLPGRLDREIAAASRLNASTSAALRAAAADQAADADLAHLVRSASRPGLSNRITQYRAQARLEHEQGGNR